MGSDCPAGSTYRSEVSGTSCMVPQFTANPRRCVRWISIARASPLPAWLDRYSLQAANTCTELRRTRWESRTTCFLWFAGCRRHSAGKLAWAPQAPMRKAHARQVGLPTSSSLSLIPKSCRGYAVGTFRASSATEPMSTIVAVLPLSDSTAFGEQDRDVTESHATTTHSRLVRGRYLVARETVTACGLRIMIITWLSYLPYLRYRTSRMARGSCLFPIIRMSHPTH